MKNLKLLDHNQKPIPWKILREVKLKSNSELEFKRNILRAYGAFHNEFPKQTWKELSKWYQWANLRPAKKRFK